MSVVAVAGPAASEFAHNWKRYVVAVQGGKRVTGSSGDVVCCVQNGWLVRARGLAAGTQQILDFVLPGDCLWPTPADALLGTSLHAAGRCEVALIPLPIAEAAVAHSPALRASLTRCAAHRQARTEERIVSLGRRDAAERLGHLLCELLSRLGGEQPSQSCDFPLRQAHLADALGLSVVHLNRTVQALRSRGLIEISKGRLSVSSFKDLAEASDFSLLYLS